MIPRPLKNKIKKSVYFGDSHIYTKDVASAVEWFKENLDKTKLLNQILLDRHMVELLIDEAFADVVKK